MLASRLYSASQRMWACVLLVLPLQGTASPTALQFPGLVDTTIYSTNARVVLAPESSCSGSVVGQGCGKRYDPWDLETYADENGRLQTYHRTSSWGNQPLGDQIRSMLFGFRGMLSDDVAIQRLTSGRVLERRRSSGVRRSPTTT